MLELSAYICIEWITWRWKKEILLGDHKSLKCSKFKDIICGIKWEKKKKRADQS